MASWLEYRLAGVEDRMREIFGSDYRVKVVRVRFEHIADDPKTGEPVYGYVRDDLGIGDDKLAMVWVGNEKAATYNMFSLDLLDDLSPKEVAEIMSFGLTHSLEKAVNNPVNI